MMSVLQEILEWSKDLPAWQSDAVRRLFAKEALSSDDVDDLFALLKVDHGIPDPKGRTPNKLTADQVPVQAAAGNHIKLVALKNLRHVNRIAENQRLPLSPNGLSVIYGDNGSGKSGYSRVLKRACRARDQAEPIYPNAFLPFDQAARAQATFEFELNGIHDEIEWIDGQAAPPMLSTLAVFDSRCARHYLDAEGDFAYVPYGLDILEGLARACKKLQEMVEKEHASITVDQTAFADLIGATRVGNLIAALSAKTKAEDVIALATVAPEEHKKHDELDRSLKEVDPKEKAIQLRLRASRIAKVAQNATQNLVIVDDNSVAKMRELVDAYRTSKAAADIASRDFNVATDFLPGTGGDAWKELFEAARKFSAEAYPGMNFADLGPNMRCPLCQQPLDQGAAHLHQFEGFVKQEAATTAKVRKQELDNGYKAFIEKSVLLGMDEELYSEIGALDSQLVPRPSNSEQLCNVFGVFLGLCLS